MATRLRQLQTVASTRLADRFERISTADHDAYLSTILLLTPKVEELSITNAGNWVPSHTWLALAMVQPTQLYHLKKSHHLRGGTDKKTYKLFLRCRHCGNSIFQVGRAACAVIMTSIRSSSNGTWLMKSSFQHILAVPDRALALGR